jgi:dienelactone hydrolase
MKAILWMLLAASWTDARVVLKSDGWELVGEWRAPDGGDPVPAALLLHRAAGSRAEYEDLAQALADRGIASLRLDLRANGESVNLGRFEEPFSENLGLLDGTYRDIDAALRWMKAQPSVEADRVAVVGASYSGEAISESLRREGAKASAYVVMSPGSFSDESILEVDGSGAPWLFLRTVEESPTSLGFIDAVFEAIERLSRTAEVRVLEGSGHATHMLEGRPRLVEEIADWLKAHAQSR